MTFAPPELKGGKLVCAIHREVPQIGTGDLADYCFAVAVDRAKVKQAEVWVHTKGDKKPGKPREVLAVSAK